MLIVPVSHVDLQASLMFCEHPGLGPWLPLANLVACLFERNAKFDKRSISKFVRRPMQVPTLNFNVSEVHCNRILHSICIFFEYYPLGDWVRQIFEKIHWLQTGIPTVLARSSPTLHFFSTRMSVISDPIASFPPKFLRRVYRAQIILPRSFCYPSIDRSMFGRVMQLIMSMRFIEVPSFLMLSQCSTLIFSHQKMVISTWHTTGIRAL